MKRLLRLTARALLLPFLLFLGLWVYSRSATAFPMSEVRSGPVQAPSLVLPNDRGGTFDLATQRGEIVLVYFGYTHCPDVCPATLNLLDAVSELLGADRRRVEQVFVTLDPATRHAGIIASLSVELRSGAGRAYRIAGGGCRGGSGLGRDLAPGRGRRLYRSHLFRCRGRS